MSEFEECQESVTKKENGGRRNEVIEKIEEDTSNHDREHAFQIQASKQVNVNAEKKS